MVKQAFALSEQFEIPVILRTTTRLSHGGQDVELSGERKIADSAHFQKDPRWVIFPAYLQSNIMRFWINYRPFGS